MPPIAGPGLAAAMGALQNRTLNPGASFARQKAELQGSDPTMTLRQAEQVKDMLNQLFVDTMQSNPNAASQISKTIVAFQRALKELQQGANVAGVVGQGQGEEGGGSQPPAIKFGPAVGGQNAQPDAGIPPL